MKIQPETKSVVTLLLASLGAAFAGFINGFLGAGGGIILLWLFTKTNPDKSPAAARDNFASVVAGVLPLCIVSAINYSAAGSTAAAQAVPFMIPAAAGGYIGGMLTDKLNTGVLKGIFSVILICAGGNMILR